MILGNCTGPNGRDGLSLVLILNRGVALPVGVYPPRLAGPQSLAPPPSHPAVGVPCASPQAGGMGINGNRFNTSPASMPCPLCHGYPPLIVRDGRHVPTCDACGGQGSVPRPAQRPAE